MRLDDSEASCEAGCEDNACGCAGGDGGAADDDESTSDGAVVELLRLVTSSSGTRISDALEWSKFEL